jgi:uncharacterized protein DUF4430
VKRRFLAVVVAALVVVPSAAAVRVHVRVEGKTRTVFGATAPLVDVKANPLDALEAASSAGEFYYHVQQTSFGPYVDQIGRYPASGDTGWVFKVNGKSPPVGADAVTLHDGDTVLWYWAAFGPAGGPKTLELRRKDNCYRVFAEDDAGNEQPAPGAVLHVGHKTMKASFTGTCVRKHRGFVRATAPGMVRSNALP